MLASTPKKSTNIGTYSKKSTNLGTLRYQWQAFLYQYRYAKMIISFSCLLGIVKLEMQKKSTCYKILDLIDVLLSFSIEEKNIEIHAVDGSVIKIQKSIKCGLLYVLPVCMVILGNEGQYHIGDMDFLKQYACILPVGNNVRLRKPPGTVWGQEQLECRYHIRRNFRL